MINKEMIDLDVYVGTQTVTLFGKERDMKRLTTEEYLTINYNDGVFTARLNSVETDLQAEYQKAYAEFPDKDDPIKAADFQIQQQQRIDKEGPKRIKKIIKDREIEIRQFLKSIIPSLTKAEMEQITVNLYNGIKREIEIQIWMDKYYTRDEAIEMIKQSEKVNFQITPPQ
jgi:DNA-binding ferritin-like protein